MCLLVQDGVDSTENVKKWLVRPDADRRDKLLACGALIVAELRLQVLQEAQFTCSAGIAHNKVGDNTFIMLISHLTENDLFLQLEKNCLLKFSGMSRCWPN